MAHHETLETFPAVSFPSSARRTAAPARTGPLALSLTLVLTATLTLQVGARAGRAFAADPFSPRSSTNGRPPPPPELKALDYFRGSWICTGVVEPSSAGPAHLIKGKATYRWDMGNFFQAVTKQDDRTKDDPTPRLARGYFGFDVATKEYTLALFFVGGGRTIATSPGWTGETLKFMGTSTRRGEPMHIEQVITRKNDTEFLSVVEGGPHAGADGNLTKVFHEKCVRNGK